MSRRAATATTLLLLGAAAAVAAVLLLRGGPDVDVRAEFTSSRGLVPRAEVRLGGAPAGSVAAIELSDRGTARVELDLHDGLPALRADATAAIRPVDLLGDVYVELTPGTSTEPLRGPIPVARTSNAPRLDELLSTFDAPVRAGLRALLAESGRALGARGAELGRAAIELRPALRASDGVLRELDAQNAALGALVQDADRAVGSLAARRGDVAGTVDGLDRLLATTDRRGRDLDRGLRDLPATLTRISGTARRLDATATAAVPLARELRDAAPGVAGALAELPPFLRGLRTAARDLTPTLAALRSTLRDGTPALRSLASGLGALTTVAPQVRELAAIARDAAPDISEGFFVNFADQGSESGRQPFDPFADPRRTYWRGAAVLSCEAFGVKVAPGCLTRFLGGAAGDGTRTTARPQRDRTPAPTVPAAVTPTPADGDRPASAPGPLLPSLLPDVREALQDLLGPSSRTGSTLQELLRP
ncbi:MCE family protein [Conexibacter sp. W3-3-2]|uniref:MCE family protein n=1 Tax=Conexibacter sp. W3-3-2 TaxID=2675227 RepID=UPI0012B9E770|nr:MlaD family protein [Conexibacter sp. W3-3-2]MTD44370.1 MCE family protein [Conexibacter sp. W3-3-2]